MTTLLLLLHLVISFVLLIAILLQQGKGSEMGATFGGGGSNTIFGSRGSGSFLTKLTAAAGAVFMLTSIGLSLVASGGISSSVVKEPARQEAPAESGPATPEGMPAAPAQGGQTEAPAAPAPTMPPAQGGQ